MPWSRKSTAIPVLPLWVVRPVQSLSACTVELYLYSPQCLYSRAIPLLLLWVVWPVQSLSACTVELYLYSPYGFVRPVQRLSACTMVHFYLYLITVSRDLIFKFSELCPHNADPLICLTKSHFSLSEEGVSFLSGTE